MKVLSAMLMVFSILLAAGNALCAPALELSTEKWDFGDIYQWTNPSITVGISNKGDSALKITDTKVSCGCTAVFLSDKEIKPGGKAFMKIDFASYTVTGKITKLVRLLTNDPARPTVDISVTGNVSAEKAGVGGVEPESTDLGVMAPYETRYIDAVIKNSGNMDLSILDIKLPDGYFLDSAMPKKAKVRDEVPVRIGYRPVKKKGVIQDEVVISTSGRDGGKLVLVVSGYVGEYGDSGGDALVVSPTGYRLGETGGLLELAVKNQGGSVVTIDGVDSSLDIKKQETGAPDIAPGETGTVKLTVDPAGLPAGSKGYVYIRIGVPVEIVGGGE